MPAAQVAAAEKMEGGAAIAAAARVAELGGVPDGEQYLLERDGGCPRRLWYGVRCSEPREGTGANDVAEDVGGKSADLVVWDVPENRARRWFLWQGKSLKESLFRKRYP